MGILSEPGIEPSPLCWQADSQLLEEAEILNHQGISGFFFFKSFAFSHIFFLIVVKCTQHKMIHFMTILSVQLVLWH